MINLQQLRYWGCICAYCNKVMPMEERTNEHIIPRDRKIFEYTIHLFKQ